MPRTVDSNGFSQEMTQDLSKLTSETRVFNFICKVIQILDGGAAIVVTDGQKSNIPIENLGQPAADFSSENNTEVTIFVKPSEDINREVKIPNENDFVEIKDVYCVPFDGKTGGSFKLLSHFYVDNITLLRKEYSCVKEISRRLENRKQPQVRIFIFRGKSLLESWVTTFLPD